MKINRDLLLALSPLCLYVLGLNAYFLPDQYDNVLYYYGAQSLSANGTYYFFDQPITRWPPVTSLLLTLPFLLGIQSVLVAKGIILLCAALGLVLSYRLLVQTKRPYPALITAIFGLLPFSVIVGTRIMSEWPFIVLSFLFLLLLERQRQQNRTLRFAFFLGLLLGAATLTRWVGFLLGAAVVAQALDHLLRQRSGLKGIVPEALTATVGATMMVLWIALFANLDTIQLPRALQPFLPTSAEAAQTVKAPVYDPFSKPGKFETIRRWDRTSNVFFC